MNSVSFYKKAPEFNFNKREVLIKKLWRFCFSSLFELFMFEDKSDVLVQFVYSYFTSIKKSSNSTS